MGKETDWGGDRMETGFSEVDRYKGRRGFKDLITIISKPVRFFSHRVEQQPMTCGKPEGTRCLACEENYDRKEKRGCLIVHIAERADGKQKYTEVGVVKVWLFGGDKWNQFCDHMDTYEQLQKKNMIGCDFFVSCDNSKDAEQFQKLNILPTLKASKLNKQTKYMLDNLEDAKKKLDWYTSAPDVEKQREIIDTARGGKYFGGGSDHGSDNSGDYSSDSGLDLEMDDGDQMTDEDISGILGDGDGDSDFEDPGALPF